jgi:hypothetical protein
MTRLMGDILTVVAMMAASVWVISVSSEFPAGGDIMPLFCAFGVIFLSVCMLVEAFLNKREVLIEKISLDLSYSYRKPYILLVLSLLYFGIIFLVGYYVSTFIFLMTASYVIGVRRYRFMLVTALILLPAMYAFFELFLQTRLPTGWLI